MDSLPSRTLFVKASYLTYSGLLEHTTMHYSNGFRVSKTNFHVEPIDVASGLWTVRVTYRVKVGRSNTDVVSATLREQRKGTIELDMGGRGSNGRKRTGTNDRQEAVTYACEQLQPLAQRAVASEQVDRALAETAGDPTWLEAFAFWRDRKQNSVEDATIKNVKRAVAVCVNRYGMHARPSEVDGQGWIHDLLEYRQEGVQFGEELKKDFGQADLRPVGYNTAAKDVRRLAEVARLCAGCEHPKIRGRKFLAHNPLDAEDVEIPEEERLERKRPITFDLYRLLVAPAEIGRKVYSAPLDDLNDGGAMRCLVSFLAFHGARRAAPQHLQRKEVAVTREEVREMIRKWGRYLRHEDIPLYENRVCILYAGEKQKMGHRDAAHYTRVVPCNQLHEAEIRRYFIAQDLWDADPEAYIFSAREDRSEPTHPATLFAPEYLYERDADGFIQKDADGNKVHLFDEDGLPLHDRRPGHWYQAVRKARKYLHMMGKEWQEYFPLRDQECVHGFRGNLETTFVNLGWLQPGKTESGQDMEPPRYIDYVLNRKMATNVRNEHYVPLEPELLLAVVDLQTMQRAMLSYTERRECEVNASLDSLRSVMGTAFPVA